MSKELKIYLASWDQDEAYRLSAVVVADSDQSVRKILDLADREAGNIKIIEVGLCTNKAIQSTKILAEETI